MESTELQSSCQPSRNVTGWYFKWLIVHCCEVWNNITELSCCIFKSLKQAVVLCSKKRFQFTEQGSYGRVFYLHLMNIYFSFQISYAVPLIFLITVLFLLKICDLTRKTYTNVLTFNGLKRQLAVSHRQSAVSNPLVNVRRFHQTVRRFCQTVRRIHQTVRRIQQTVSSMEKALVVTL